MGKEVAKKEENAVGTALDPSLFGESQISSSDIVIPKVWVMQKTSELVDEGAANIGDFVNSNTKQVIGSITDPVKFIPFHLDKTWIVERMGDGGRFEYVRTDPVTPANENQQWTQIIDNVEHKFSKSMNFYVLLVDDLSLPAVISFKSTSAKSGKMLAMQMYVANRREGKHQAAYCMELGGEKQKNDKGTYIVMHTKVSRPVKPEEEQACLEWFKTVSAGGAKVQEETQTEAAPKAAATAQSKF